MLTCYRIKSYCDWRTYSTFHIWLLHYVFSLHTRLRNIPFGIKQYPGFHDYMLVVRPWCFCGRHPSLLNHPSPRLAAGSPFYFIYFCNKWCRELVLCVHRKLFPNCTGITVQGSGINGCLVLCCLCDGIGRVNVLRNHNWIAWLTYMLLQAEATHVCVLTPTIWGPVKGRFESCLQDYVMFHCNLQFRVLYFLYTFIINRLY
jgi:hypothetical protein